MDVKIKINKYISNSKRKLENPMEKRREFHKKNIKEFEKFFMINFDFSGERSFRNLCEILKALFLRKQKDYIKAC